MTQSTTNWNDRESLNLTCYGSIERVFSPIMENSSKMFQNIA